MIRSPKKCFWQETLEKFGKQKSNSISRSKNLSQKWQTSMQKASPKHRPAKNPASQKAKQSPTKNRFKFQTNNPKTGRRALAHRPVFGGAL